MTISCVLTSRHKSLIHPVLEDIKREYLVERIKPVPPGYQSLIEFPSHFEIETINACNARCPMCTIDEWDKEQKMMSDDLFLKIITEIAEYRSFVKRVNLYRDGEPLLDKKLPDRIKLCKSLGIPNVSISTNVSLLDEHLGSNLLDAGLDMITLSIDSLNKEAYESVRRGLNFEKVMENALSFLRLRNEKNSTCEVWIRMIRQEVNKDEFHSYKEFWSNTGLLRKDQDRVYYHNIFNWGGQLDQFGAVSENTEKHLPCVSLWSLMPIFANGDVPMCNIDFSCNHKMGNVNDHSIREIWQSQALAQIRIDHMNGSKSNYDMCRDCNVWEEVPQRDGTRTVSSQYANILTPTPSVS